MQIIQKTLQLHITQKIVLHEVVDQQPSPHSEHKVIGVPIKGPVGLGGNHLLRLPNKGGCCPKRKRNHPALPGNNVGTGDPIPLTLPLPCGATGMHGELVFVGCSLLGRGAEPLVRTQFLEHPPTLIFGANHLTKWIQHPQKPPIPFLSPHNPHQGGGFWGGGQRVRAQLEQS